MKTNLKILLASEYFPPEVKGGGELSAELLARNLVSAGHEVHILTSKTDAQSYSPPRGVLMHRTLQAASPTSHVGNFRRLFALPRQIRREVSRLRAEQDFDVIHYLNVVSVLGSLPRIKNQFATINSHQPFCPKGNLFYKEREPCTGCNPSKFLGCLTCSEYVGKTRVPPALRLNPLFLVLLYQNYLRFRAALRNVRPIAVSTYVSEQLAHIGFPGAPIVPNFSHGFSSRKSGRKRRDRVSILFLGALERIKGVGLLLEAYAALPVEARSRTVLQIAGSGSLQEELERQAPQGVEFLGQMSPQRAQQMIAQCDIVVLPSLWPEPLSRVLLEAACLGKAVIATDVGGNPDVISDGENGLLVEPEQRALTDAMAMLIRDRKLRDSLAERNLRRGKERFSSKKILAEIKTLYTKA